MFCRPNILKNDSRDKHTIYYNNNMQADARDEIEKYIIGSRANDRDRKVSVSVGTRGKYHYTWLQVVDHVSDYI